MTHRFITAILAMTTAWTPAKTDSAQTPSVPPCAAFRNGGQPGAQVPSDQVPTYVDEPVEQLKKTVPGLSGIRIEAVRNSANGGPSIAAQDKTTSILTRASAAIAGLYHRMPNLIAKEEVKEPTDKVLENDLPTNRSDGSWMETVPQGIPIVHFETRFYTYRIVHNQTPAGGDAFDEFRTDARDQPIDKSDHDALLPFSAGFATTWLLFLPGNLPQSHFRYLGTQKIDDRETYVLVFAQDPGREGLRTAIESSNGRCSTPMQGVAWIDQSTFQIVRVQTDLLTPLPSIQLNQLRSIAEYGAVKIRSLDLTLWLPNDVQIQWRTAHGAGREIHQYSHYRLFHSTARIFPAGESPAP